MMEYGQLAYSTYVSALQMDHVCTWDDLSTAMQRVWAIVETTCQGRPLLPLAPPLLLEVNHE